MYTELDVELNASAPLLSGQAWPHHHREQVANPGPGARNPEGSLCRWTQLPGTPSTRTYILLWIISCRIDNLLCDNLLYNSPL